MLVRMQELIARAKQVVATWITIIISPLQKRYKLKYHGDLLL
ncbi:MAG TPA: hypothetical protein VF043_34715 [Ktedonobacteraceae bacterium]